MGYGLWSIDKTFHNMIKKIVAIGPESTGKSTLCEQLAQYFQTIWCKEYAREYLHANGVKYDYNDLLKIAKGQLAQEDNCIDELNNQYSKINSTTHHSPLTTHRSQLAAFVHRH
jgi:nicotinamide riboside kinase